MDLYRLHLPILVSLFSPQAHYFWTFNYSSLLPGNAVVSFLIYLFLLAFIWPPAGSNRFQQHLFLAVVKMVFGVTQQLFSMPESLEVACLQISSSSTPKTKEKAKACSWNNLPIINNFDRTQIDLQDSFLFLR